MNALRLFKEVFLSLLAVLIGNTAIYRAHFLASFFTVEADTLGTEVRVYLIYLITLSDCPVGTLRLTNITVNTLISNH